MSDYPWLAPHVNLGTAVIAGAAAAYTAYAGLVRGPRGYRRLVAARAAGDHAAIRRRYRTAWVVQAARCVLVLAVVAADPGVSRADVGLVLPAGADVADTWGWFAYACGLILLAGLVLRRRALAGRRVPGQRLFAALVARDGERWQAAGVALGAGLSEEMLFRGLFIAVAVDRLGLSPVPALLVVSAGFGAVHLYQGWLGVLGTTIAGLALGAFYFETQSLLMPIVLHVLVDLRGLVLVPVAGHASGARHADDERWAGPAQPRFEHEQRNPGGRPPHNAGPSRRSAEDGPPVLP